MDLDNKHQQSPLFRQEVLAAKNEERLSSVILAPHFSFALLACLAFVIAGLLIAFLYFGSYTRRVTVSGQLVPEAGLIRVVTPQAGVVLEKHVVEGQHVKAGETLFVLSSDRVGLSNQELQADVAQQIAQRKASMENEINRNKSAEKDELALIKQRLSFLANEAQTVQTQMEQQKQRLALATETYQRYKNLAEKDYIPHEQLIQKELELSEQQSRLQGLERDLLANSRDQAAARREMSDTQTRFANQNSQLERTISSAHQENTEVESRSRVVITAPQAGIATLVVNDVGQAVDGSKQMMSIIPEHSNLEARLYAPSSAIGFIRAGDRVLLRYQPYPYQKFGLHEGAVKAVSTATVSNQELTGANIEGLLPAEQVYSIIVTLKSQTVQVYGAPRPLQSGMRLDADVLLENRRLYEWALEPLFSITGKMRH